MLATDRSVSRLASTSLPPFLMGRKTGPSMIAATSSQSLRAQIGRRREPYGIATKSPALAWSVFERLISTWKPSGHSSRSSTFSAISSERRSAPVKPMSKRARSRRPRRSGASLRRWRVWFRPLPETSASLRFPGSVLSRRVPPLRLRCRWEPQTQRRGA